MSDSVRVESLYPLLILAQITLSALSTGSRAGGLRRPLRKRTSSPSATRQVPEMNAVSRLCPFCFGGLKTAGWAALCGKRRKTPSPTATR